MNINVLIYENMKRIDNLREFQEWKQELVCYISYIRCYKEPRCEWQNILLMDKPEDVSDSLLPTFSQNIKRDWCSFPYHHRITYLSAFCTKRGGKFSAVVRSGGLSCRSGSSLTALSCVCSIIQRARPEIASNAVLCIQTCCRERKQATANVRRQTATYRNQHVRTGDKRTFRKRC